MTAPPRKPKCEEELMVPSGKAARDISLEVAAKMVAAANEAIAEAEDAGLERAGDTGTTVSWLPCRMFPAEGE